MLQVCEHVVDGTFVADDNVRAVSEGVCLGLFDAHSHVRWGLSVQVQWVEFGIVGVVEREMVEFECVTRGWFLDELCRARSVNVTVNGW